MLSPKTRKTSLYRGDPVWHGDGLSPNAVHCLVPGCILTNERLLLGFGGQSTYGTVNSESKNKLLCKNPKCANTTGSKFNQLSLVAETQLPSDSTNTWNSSLLSWKQLRSFNTQVILYLLRRPLICHTALSDKTQLSSCDRRSHRLSKGELGAQKVCSPTSHIHMFAFKCIFNGTASSHLCEFSRKVTE